MSKRWLLIGLIIILLICGGLGLVIVSNATNKTKAQGVRGRITIFKCVTDTEESCPHYTFTIIAKKANNKTVAGQVSPDATGVYKLSLAPGVYQIEFKTNPSTPTSSPETVVVKSKQFVDLNWAVSPPEEKPEPPKRPDGIPDPSTLKFH